MDTDLQNLTPDNHGTSTLTYIKTQLYQLRNLQSNNLDRYPAQFFEDALELLNSLQLALKFAEMLENKITRREIR